MVLKNKEITVPKTTEEKPDTLKNIKEYVKAGTRKIGNAVLSIIEKLPIIGKRG